jgi:antirestriction protein ArdC
MQSQHTAGERPAGSVYERVTEQVLAELAKGTAPWRRPWRVEFGLPRNLDSRKAYRGANILTLMSTALAVNYPTNWWVTYKQAQALGGHVDRGAHGVPIVFYGRTPSETTTHADAQDELVITNVRWRPVLKVYTVFNIGQCSGIVAPETPQVAWQPIAAAERITASAGVPIRYHGSETYYQPGKDVITMPPRPAFDTETRFYETLLHELVHATSHESRLARPLGLRGTEQYAWEELIAEMGSAMLSVVAGIPAPDFPNMAAYVDAWQSRMRRDPQAICEAAAAAQKAVEWLLTKADLALPA